MWLEVDVSQMKDRGQHPVDAGLLLWSEAQDVHGIQQTSKILSIIFSFYGAIPSLYSGRHTDTHTHTHTYNIMP